MTFRLIPKTKGGPFYLVFHGFRIRVEFKVRVRVGFRVSVGFRVRVGV